MKKSQILHLAILCGLGLSSGFLMRRLSSEDFHTIPRATQIPSGGGNAPSLPAPSAKPALPEISIVRSTDTVASILTLDPATNYSRIALWAAAASEQDLAAYCAGCQTGKRNLDVLNLIFLNWTRKNPQAAITAATGMGMEQNAWWSWAANDPQAALTASRAVGKNAQLQVACGIGEFNPEWLRTHLDQIPQEFRSEVFGRMKNWPDSQNPLASLKFMKENGMGFDEGTFKTLVRKDPWAALDWLKENPPVAGNFYSGNNQETKSLVSTLAQDRPDDLARMAEQMPAGETKRAMDKALFDQLLEADPAAALDQVRKIETPRVAAQRLGQIGLSMLAREPDKAFEIGGEILKANPGKVDIENFIQFQGGTMSSDMPGPASELLDALFNKDRQRMMDLAAGLSAGQKGISQTLSRQMSKWAGEDIKGLTDWTNAQTAPLVLQSAKQTVGSELSKQGQYEESIEWARSANSEEDWNVAYMLYRWQRADPAAAAAWMEKSDLTADQKSKIKERLQRYSR